SDWYYRAVLSGEVLTLDPAYFRLRKPLERRMYELARKHCGSQPTWSISFDVLKKKTGAITNDRRMRQFLRDIVEQNHLPQYTVSMDDAGKV
ncbi:replication initiator protein A, partial [Acinetobacter baumannii]